MGTIQIKKVEKKVVTGKVGENRQKVTKTYGKIIYRGTLGLNEMAEHIMKHGTVYTEDVVIGVITKLKNCIQEMLADGYKVKLDGIGTLYPVTTSSGVADAKDFNAQENITGHCGRFLFIHPWTQFFNPGDRKDMPLSCCNNIEFRNIQVEAETMWDVKTSDKYELRDFSLDGHPLDVSPAYL